MGKLTDRLDAINAKLRKETLKADEKIEAAEAKAEEAKACAEAKAEEVKASVEAKVEEAKASVEAAKARAEARKDEVTEKIQGSIDECKAKIEAKCEQKDKENWAAYITALLEYAEDCEAASVLLEAEAVLAAAMAAEELCDYVDKYGDEA